MRDGERVRQRNRASERKRERSLEGGALTRKRERWIFFLIASFELNGLMKRNV